VLCSTATCFPARVGVSVRIISIETAKVGNVTHSDASANVEIENVALSNVTVTRQAKALAVNELRKQRDADALLAGRGRARLAY
jgi:hypothetical protein